MTQAPPRPAAAVPLERLSLRRNERGLVLGGVGTGKSTLCDKLGAEFVHRYARLGGRRLILDTKPRYRAELTARGTSARRRYRGWSHGPVIPGSVVVDDPGELGLAWDTGATTVIVQCDDSREYPRLLAAAAAFIRSSRASRPQLLQVDETLDFFHANGQPKGGDDAIIRAARAGRERGTAALYGAQRTKGFNPTLMSELERLYCMRLDYAADLKRVQEMGCPPFPNLTEKHLFRYWWKGDYRRVYGPYRLGV